MEIADYIAKQPAERRKILTQIHDAIVHNDKKVTPVVALMMGKEMINYQAPGIYKYGLSSVKDYMSLHAMPIYGSPALHEKYRKLLPLANFRKGCINFVNEEEMPLAIVKDLIRDCSGIDLLAMKKEYEKAKAKKQKAK